MPPDLEKYILLFLKESDRPTAGFTLSPLAADGSVRVFHRVTLPASRGSFIVMSNPPVDDFARRENRAYVAIGRHLFSRKIPVPEIYRYNLEHGWVIMEDLGPKNLQDRVSSTGDPVTLYESVLECLCRLQISGSEGFDPRWCCQTRQYDRTVMRCHESNYFRDAFLHAYLGMKKEWPELDAAFDHLAETASGADSRFFLHRDFQSRNIMIAGKNIGIIDWQGGRLGPLAYDLASLIIDPYTRLSGIQQRVVFHIYLDMIREHNPAWTASIERYYPYLAIQRNLQILGAFAYLTKTRGKPYFEAFIPPALHTLRELLHQVPDTRLLPLRDTINRLHDVRPGIKKTNPEGSCKRTTLVPIRK